MPDGAVAGAPDGHWGNEQLRGFRPANPEFEQVDVDIDCTKQLE